MMNHVSMSWYGHRKVFAIQPTKLSFTDNLLRQWECGNSEFKHTHIYIWYTHTLPHWRDLFKGCFLVPTYSLDFLFFSLHFLSKTKFLRLRFFSCYYSAVLLCELWLLDKKSWRLFLYIMLSTHIFWVIILFWLSVVKRKKWDWWVPRLCRWYCWFFVFPHSLRRKFRTRNVGVCAWVFSFSLGRHSSLADDYLYKLLLYILYLWLYILNLLQKL